VEHFVCCLQKYVFVLKRANLRAIFLSNRIGLKCRIIGWLRDSDDDLSPIRCHRRRIDAFVHFSAVRSIVAFFFVSERMSRCVCGRYSAIFAIFVEIYRQMEDFLLRVEHVSKHYSGHTALDDVSLDIPRGSVYGLLGPNGAGKTTLIRIVNRITAPDEGRVLFDGRPLASADVQRIGYLPEERGLYKKMKVGEQALFFARLKGLSRAEAVRRLRVWFDRFDIASWWNRRVEELSKGMAQKVQFIVTVLHEPELLIFDEPFSGFDPINANLLKEEILGLRDRGATVIFSTHNMSSVEEVCDHITLIDRSRNILSGAVDEIRRRHGQNLFRLEYRGDEAALRRALAGRCEVVASGGDLPAEEAAVVLHASTEGLPELQSLTVHVADDAALRGVIAAANETVALRSFAEQIPSMNDIFIRAVDGSL